MRRLIAHAGSHKTGTTAFQSWLQQNRRGLFDAGYLVPETRSGVGNHTGLVQAICRRDRDSPVSRNFRFAAEAYSAHDVLLSAERMEVLEIPELKILARQFRRIADEATVILVVRDPIAALNSSFAQRRKAMAWRGGGFAAFLDQMLVDRPDLRCRVERFESVGLALRLLPYDTVFTAKGSPRAIMELDLFGDVAAGFDWSQSTRGNDSMGAIALIVMGLLLDTILARNPAHDRRSPRELRARVIALVAERFVDLPFNGFTPETHAQVIAHYAESNAWVAGRFFATSWAEALPPQPIRAVSPETIADLTPADAAAVREIADTVLCEADAAGWFDPRFDSEQRKQERKRARAAASAD